MKRISRLIIGLMLLKCSFVHAQTLDGVVKSVKGRSVGHTKVLLKHKNITLQTQTDSQERLLFQEVASGKYFFSAEKNHMLTFAQRLAVSTNDKVMKVKLIPIEFAVYHYLPVKTVYL